MSLSAFNDYIRLEKRFSPHTLNAYGKDLERFATYCKSHYQLTDLAQVQYPIIREWIVGLSSTGLKNQTINRKCSPMQFHRQLKTTPKLVVPLTEKEFLTVIEMYDHSHFEGARDALILELLYTTGMRRAELLSLTLHAIDRNKRQLQVVGKRNKTRIIPLLPKVISQMDGYLAHRDQIEKAKESHWLFVNRKGKELNPSHIYKCVTAYLSKVSTKEKVSPHVLRHTFATHLLNRGADINSIKEILGHKSLSSTQIYAKVQLPKMKQDYLTAHPRA
ncbi:MAG: tyrosine-type recombinase/integrase [Flavobacteriaceae bacterium]